MKTKTTFTVAIEKLLTNLFVRESLDQDHVLNLAALIENGVQMKDLIEVVDNKDGTYTIVEGRHRKEAFEVVGTKEVKIKVLEFDDAAEMIAYAYKANTGGSLPPTATDTEHTIKMLLDEGVAKKNIPDMIGLPAKMATNFINNIASKAARAKLLRALDDFVDGDGKMTLAQAAEKHGVPLQTLKETLSRTRKKERRGVKEVKRTLTTRAKSASSFLVGMMKKLTREYDEGNVTKKQIQTIFAQIEEQQKLAGRSVKDWKARFEAKFNGGNVEKEKEVA